MLKKRIIPCLLLKGGRCVKGVNFKNHRDVGHPITNAKIYESQGADELIFLNIEPAKNERGALLKMVRKAADECFMPITVGGGIKTVGQINDLLRAGADKVAINTAAVENPRFISQAAEKYGKQCIVISIDYKKNKQGIDEIYINNGLKPAGKNPFGWAREAEKLGAGEILLTNIAKEGARQGYDLKMIKQVSGALKIPVIASGGAGSLEDLKKAIKIAGASAVSLGSLLHFTDQTVIKARDYLYTNGIEVRINV